MKFTMLDFQNLSSISTSWGIFWNLYCKLVWRVHYLCCSKKSRNSLHRLCRANGWNSWAQSCGGD